MTARLLHYSATPVEAVRSCEQSNDRYRPDKPKGFWLSVEGENDWRSWCEGEDYGDVGSKIVHEVTLAASANLLHLTTADDVLVFGERYGLGGLRSGRAIDRGSGVDWERVAQRFHGIVIAPYQWSLRLDRRTNWYYGWDCASGCIWHADAVASIAVLHSSRHAVAGCEEVRP